MHAVSAPPFGFAVQVGRARFIVTSIGAGSDDLRILLGTGATIGDKIALRTAWGPTMQQFFDGSLTAVYCVSSERKRSRGASWRCQGRVPTACKASDS
jgi:hypothetical protein